MIINPATIYSILGNPNSLIPLALKDVSATAGMTAGSLITGKEEGIDRLIDETGTACIWLFGIPFSKSILNNTVFRALGLDYKFDARNFKDKDILKKIKEYAPEEKIKQNIEKIETKEKLFKNMVTARFVISTALTLASYLLLTKVKQNYTEKKIRQNLIDEYNQKIQAEQKSKENNIVNEPKSDIEAVPSFKGIGSFVETFAFSPVKNMWILDGGITYERLKNSRSPQEFAGYAIKEGILLMFLYYAGGKIQSLMEKHATKKFNKSIDLDARVIEDKDFQQAFKDGTIEKSLQEFKTANTSNVNLYEFLHKQPDNIIVKSAKQSDIIKVYKGNKKFNLAEYFNKNDKIGQIDTREYIDLEEIKGVDKKITELYSQYKNAIKNGETTEKFFAQVRKLKRTSIWANIGASILALGVITPAAILLKRFLSKEDTEFQTKKDIRNQLIKEGVIA